MKITLPITIIISSIILGVFYYTSQISKQKSIERQQRIKIEQKQKDNFMKLETSIKNEIILDECLEKAELQAKNLNQAVLDNAIGKQYNSITRTLDDIEHQLEKDKDECYKRYQ